MAALAAALLLSLGVLEDERLIVKLNNNRKMPLIGLGVGNMAQEKIEPSTLFAIEKGVRLLDAEHNSQSEHVLGRHEILKSLMHRMTDQEPVTVISKVWHTHLGYERTKLSVEESMNRMGRNNVEVVLLHHPRCNDDHPSMDCEADENELPAHVKKASLL